MKCVIKNYVSLSLQICANNLLSVIIIFDIELMYILPSYLFEHNLISNNHVNKLLYIEHLK